MKLLVFLIKISRFFTSLDMLSTYVALFILSASQYFLTNDLNNSITNPAIDLLTGIQWKSLFFGVFLSWSFAMILSVTLSDFLKYFNIEIDDMVFVLAYILFSFFLVYNLLALLTVEQFSLLSTIIALPLFILFPSSFRKMQEIIKRNRMKKANKAAQDKDK